MDSAHKATDKALTALERRIHDVYREAQRDLEAKTEDFWRRHEAKDRIYRQKLADGEITEDQYRAWLRGQVFQGEQWESKLAQITATLTNADRVAQSLINGEIYGVFANNANWMAYTMEHGLGLNFGFGLYDPGTVARLLKQDPDLLPRYKLDIPKDRRWNQKQVTRQITQGIIQGEPLEKIAKRLENVTDHDENLCRTRARTAMTGAQNAGRMDTIKRAEGMGIRTRKEWLATLDGHTRFSHASLDGQTVDADKPFKSELGDIMYPGDPHAHPANVYNCRCTMIADVVDFPDEYKAERYDNIDGKPIAGMTYREWEDAKRAGNG